MKFMHVLMVMILVLAACPYAGAADDTMTKAVVVNYLFTEGKVTYMSSRVVYGYPPNNIGNNDFVVNLVSGQGGTLGSYGIGDPRIRYYEDGADIIDEVEFSVVLPFSTEAREVRIYERDGTTLVSTADISGTITSFCSQHPDDPECTVAATPTGIPLGWGTILAGLGVAMFMLLKRS